MINPTRERGKLVNLSEVINCGCFSDTTRLFRVTALSLKFITNLKSAKNKRREPTMVEMLQHVQQVGNEDSLNAHDLEDWLNLDNELPTTEQMSDEQILATVTGHSNENESSDEEDDGQEEKQVSNSEAAECFKKCLSWMEGQNNVDPVQVMQLRRMMDFAMRSRYKTLKQTSMFQFFRSDE